MWDSDFYPIFKLTKPAVPIVLEKEISINQKSVIVAQGYQLNNEMNLVYLRDVIFEKQPDGSDYVRCRGEFGEPVKNHSPWLAAAPKWHYYWQCLWMLTYGLDMFNMKPATLALEDEPFAESFEFFNERGRVQGTSYFQICLYCLPRRIGCNEYNTVPREIVW